MQPLTHHLQLILNQEYMACHTYHNVTGSWHKEGLWPWGVDPLGTHCKQINPQENYSVAGHLLMLNSKF